MKRTFWKKALMFLATTAVSVSVGIAAYADEAGAAELNSLLQPAEGEASKVVQLDKDYDITGATNRVTVSGNVTLDLNGHEIKAASTIPGNILVSGTLTLKDSGTTGRIYTETDYTGSSTGYGVISVSGGTFNMESGTIYAVRSDTVNKGQFGVTVVNEGTVNISGGRIEAGWYAVSGNGTDNNGTTINVSGGELISTTDYAIYHPQAGTLNITNGLVTGGAGGIVMNRGTLKISGGTIASAGSGDTGNWGDGTGGLSDYAVKLNAAYGNVNATISGGKFVAGMEAVCVGGGTNGTVEVSVTGGEFSDPSIFGLNPTGNINVKLNKDYTGDVDIPAGVKATLDLNGKTLTGKVVSKGNLTIVDSTATVEPIVSGDYKTIKYNSGKIYYHNTPRETAVTAQDGGTVTLESGTVDCNYIGVCAEGDCSGNSEINSIVNVKGGYVVATEFAASAQGKGAELNITGGVLVANDNAAVAGNGSMPPENDYLSGTVMNISGGTMISHIQSTGYIACGVYHPQGGYLNITGGTIYADGGVGVLVRAGEVKISDNATIVATGNSSGKVGDSKVIANCYAVQVDKESNYPGCSVVDAKVEISGGTIKSDATCLDVLPKQNDTTKRIVVSGGQFSNDVQAFCAEGYTGNVKVGDYYLVHQHNSNIEKTPAVAPTCTKAGFTAEMSCSVCRTVTVPPVVVNATGHNLKLVEAVAATTEKEGNLAHYVCQKDNSEWFWDAAGNNPIANHSAVVTAKLTSQTEELNSEVGKPEETFTVTAEGSATSVAVKIDTDKLMENTADTMATADSNSELKQNAVKKLADAGVTATAEEVTLILTPAVEVENVKVDEQKATITMDISLVCKVEAKAGGAVVPVAKETVPNEQIKQDTVITISVPESWNGKSIIVRHVTKSRGVKLYSAVAADDTVTFTVPKKDGFSPFTLFVDDGKTVTVKLDSETKTYNRTDVVNETALPAASKYNYAFKGWKFEGIDGQYFNMTAELFEALLDKNAVVIGSSVFEGPLSEHPEIEEAKKNGTWGVDENKPAATAKPAAAAAVTPVRSSIPKTSDDSNLMLWVCLMGIAALGLGGAVYMKKRNHQ